MDYIFLGANFNKNNFFYNFNGKSNFFKDTKFLKKLLSHKNIFIGTIEDSNYLCHNNEIENLFYITTSEALLYDFLKLNNSTNKFVNFEIEQNILIINLKNNITDFSYFNVYFQDKAYTATLIKNENSSSFTFDSIDFELKYILEKKYNCTIPFATVQSLRLKLENTFDSTSISESNLTLSCNDYNLAINRVLQTFYKNELFFKNKKCNYIIFFSELYLSATLVSKIKKISNSLGINFLDFDFEPVRGASYYVENMLANNSHFPLENEHVKNDLIQIKKLCIRYKNSILIGEKKEILYTLKFLEKKIVLSPYKLDYLEEILNFLNSSDNIALGRFCYLLGIIAYPFTHLHLNIEQIFLKYISSENLIKYYSGYFPEHIIYCVIGLAKLERVGSEIDLKNILEYKNCKKLYPYVILSLSFMGNTSEIFEILLNFLKQDNRFKKEATVALGVFALKNPNYDRNDMNVVLIFLAKQIRKKYCFYIDEILYCILEIALKNNGLHDSVLQNLINTISIIDNKYISNLKLKKIVLKTLNIIPLEDIELIELSEIRNNILPSYFQKI
ncbi:MAG: hypothetical protein ACRCZ9_06740 [Fusobacteriaceae bacterium]